MNKNQTFRHPLVVATFLACATIVLTTTVNAGREVLQAVDKVDAHQFRLLDSGVKNLRADLSLNPGGNGATMHFYDSDEIPVVRIMSKNGRGSIALWDGSIWKPVLTR